MHRQSNTLLYVVGGCVLAIAIVIVLVRSASPPDEEKKASPLAGLRLTGALPSASASEFADEEGEERVQMLPITVDGKQGILVRYQTDVLFEPIQQNVAENIFTKVKREAEKVGVEVIVIMAVGPSGDGGPVLPETHTVGFRRLIDGTWVPMQETDFGLPDDLEGPPIPSASDSASDSAAPFGSSVPLFIPH